MIKSKFKTRLIISAILGIITLIGITYFERNIELGLIAGLVLFIFFMIITSENLAKWLREKAEREKLEREEAKRWKREEYYREKGRQQGIRDFERGEEARKEHQKRIRKFESNIGRY